MNPGDVIVFNQILEYKTSKDTNLWPTFTFTYTYGTSCAGVANVTLTPQSINFTPTQGVKTFTLTGANLTGNLTLTASKGLIVSPTTIAAESGGTIASANQTVTVTWDSGATLGGYINISGGGLLSTKQETVTSSGFSEFCNTVISQDNNGTSNMAYLTVTTSTDKTQVILGIAPFDPNAGAIAKFNSLGTIKVNGTTVTPTITYNDNNAKTVATLTFASALSNGDVVTFGGALVWTLSGTLWNNGNCFINAAKTYTVGLGCSVAQADNTPPVVVSASNISTTSYNAVISVNASDNIGVTNIHFVDVANSINVTQLAKSDNGTASYTIPNLQGNTAYSFVVTALDLAGNETAVGNAKTVAFTTLNTPQITAVPSSLDFTPTTGSKTFTLSGAYITEAIQLSAPAGYTITPSTFVPTAGTIAATTVAVNWTNGLGNKIGVSGGGLQNPVKLLDLTNSGGFSDYCSYVITQGGGATLTTPALVNISLNSDKTILTYKIAPFDITGDATWNGNSLGATVILLNEVAATPTRTAVDSHTITFTFSQPLVVGDVISYAAATTLVWTTTGYTNYANNGNCFIDAWSKTYTVGPNCNATSYNVTTNTNISNLSCVNCDVTVSNGGTLTLDVASSILNNITVAAGGKLTNTNALAANSITLQADPTGVLGNGTYVDNGTSTSIPTATVEQYLTAGRNWYISSPLTAAQSGVVTSTSGNLLWSYDETNTGGVLWNPIYATNTSLNTMQGYVTKVLANGVITFTGGALFTGTKTVTLNRTMNNGQANRGYNLVGNPYPSYLDWNLAQNNPDNNLGTSIWTRTNNSGYVFATYNASGGQFTNNGTQFIAPMQAFWVYVKDDSNGATTNGTLAVTNAMRSHESGTNRLKAPAANNSLQQLLRLQLSNGTNNDETVIYTNPSAANGFDNYDSPKMSNGNPAPDIYSVIGNQNLAINGFNSLAANQEIALGFRTGISSDFTIKATDVRNFDANTKIVLKDNLLNTEQELTAGSAYSFSSEAVSTASRFTVIFRTSSAATSVSELNDNNPIVVFRNANNQITVNIPAEMVGKASVSVYNAVGQKLENKPLTSTVNVLRSSYTAGVYLVSVIANGKATTRKVVIN
jgi:hypothetical protein